MRTLLLILLMSNLVFSGRVFTLYKDSSWATYQMVHPLKTVNSTTTNFFGELHFDSTLNGIQITVIADPKTFSCGTEFIDNYALKIVEYSKYKEIKFTGSFVKKVDEYNYVVYGGLLFHGIYKEMEIPIQLKRNGTYVSATGEFPVYLSDFNLKRPRPLGMYIDNKLTIFFKLTADTGY